MIFDFWKWCELTITNDEDRYIKIMGALEAAGVQCRVKVQNIGHGNRRTGSLGALGENRRYVCIYQIYVQKTHIERAKLICCRVR